MIPTVGRILHLRIGGTKALPVLRPGIIVQVWEGSQTVNAQVVLDGSNDADQPWVVTVGADALKGLAWATSLTQGDEVGEWRWPAITPPSPPKA